jgi:hypothetical protein
MKAGAAKEPANPHECWYARSRLYKHQAETAEVPRAKHLGVGLRISHVIRPPMIDRIDRYVAVDVRPIGHDEWGSSKGPVRGAFGPRFYHAKILETFFDLLQGVASRSRIARPCVTSGGPHKGEDRAQEPDQNRETRPRAGL